MRRTKKTATRSAAKRRPAKSRRPAVRGCWARVRVRDGAPIPAWIDGATWNGWIVPWFTDASMDLIGDAYFTEEFEDRAPHVEHSGVYSVKDEDERVIELDRVLMRIGKDLLPMTDAGPMKWCWEIVPEPANPREVPKDYVQRLARQIKQ